MAQHDYVIDNSTGANVRADINSALLAISSTNSGSSAPSTTYAFQLFANTTTSKLQIRNAANNAFVDLLGLDGSIALPDGSVSAPSLGFSDDTNTGLFSSAADTLNFTTGGVERMELGATTIFNEDGADVDFRIEGDTEANLFYVDAGNDRIGIGTASPDERLNIKNGKIRIENAIVSNNDSIISYDNQEFIIDVDPNSVRGSSAFQVKVDGTLGFVLDDSRRVLIGTTTAGHTDMDDITIATAGNTGITIRSGTTSDGFLAFADGTSGNAQFEGFIQYDHSTNLMRIATGATTRVAIDSSGNVGIGHASPAKLLDVKGGDGATVEQYLRNNTINLLSKIVTTDHAQFGTETAHPLVFLTSNGERIRIDSSGHFLHATTSSSAPDGNGGTLIKSDGNGSFIQISKKTTSAVPAMEFYNANGRVGQIIPSGSSTSFTTSSDYRLKENAVAISDGITRLKTLKPYKFNFKSDASTTLDGFFAHEVTAVPEAITGTKDEVDSDNKPVYQGIDQSKLVPLLVAAVQELIGKVEALEAA